MKVQSEEIMYTVIEEILPIYEWQELNVKALPTPY
jgi:hypothetical protein